MTTWKLRESIENGTEAGEEYGSPQATAVEESVLAMTEDEKGNALGRWTVMGMDESGRQECQAKGKVVRYVCLGCFVIQSMQGISLTLAPGFRYFNVHPELLQEPIEVGTGSPVS